MRINYYSFKHYGVLWLVAGAVLFAIALFINLTYIQPTNFKAQYRQRQLADCLTTTTSKVICQEHFAKH